MRTTTACACRAYPSFQLLEADHRRVEEWFEQFEKARSEDKKAELAERICRALKVHTTIEEEIFYPAFLEATGDKEIHHEAEIEHDGAKRLIAQIEGSSPADDYFDSKVTVLSEMIKHHVKEEEQRDGMFAEARKAEMDLKFVGEQLQARKAELMGQRKRTPRNRAERQGIGAAQLKERLTFAAAGPSAMTDHPVHFESHCRSWP